MLSVVEVYTSWLDRINKDENSYASIAMFNRFSKLGELRLIDWLSGDVANEKPPIPFLSQKNKDWLSLFINKYPAHITGGIITKPDDYYVYDNLYKLGSPLPADCEEDVSEKESCNTTIEIVDGDVFTSRCNTHIEELKPRNKPIAKEIGETFEFMPKDLGSITLEYIRLPKFAKIISKTDPVYNDEVPDENASTNYEWPEFAMEPLVYFISDLFFNHVREKSGKEFNIQSGKTVRG